MKVHFVSVLGFLSISLNFSSWKSPINNVFDLSYFDKCEKKN